MRDLKFHEYFDQPSAGLAPLLMVIIFTVAYVGSQSLFVECNHPGVVACNGMKTAGVINPVTGDAAEGAPAAGKPRLGTIYAARLKWMFFTVANFLLQAISIIVFAVILLNWYRGIWVALIALGCFAIGLILASIDSLPLAKPLLDMTVAKDPEGIADVVFILRLSTGLGLGFALFLAASLTGLLFHREDASNRIGELIEKRKHLSILLYFSAALLILGVLRGNAEFAFVSAFVNPTDSPSLKEFFESLTAILGGFYTIYLVGVYLPAAFVIQKRAERAAVASAGDAADSAAGLLTANGFTFSFRDAIPKILALAGPILTGFSSNVLGL